MEVVFYLIPVALIILAGAIWTFFWAVKNDQFEDMEGPAQSIIFDDKEERRKSSAADQTPVSGNSDPAKENTENDDG